MDGWQDADIYATNDTAVDYPWNIKAWVTFHPEKMRDWIARGPTYKIDLVTHLKSKADDSGITGWRIVDAKWPRRNGGMAKENAPCSGIYAAKVAMEDGYNEVCLVGCPMDDRPHYKRPNEPWKAHTRCQLLMKNILDRLLAHPVYSMSGWTCEKLGRPSVNEPAAQALQL